MITITNLILCLSEALHIAFLILFGPKTSAEVAPVEFEVCKPNKFYTVPLKICKETLKCSGNITHFNLRLK